MTTDIIHTVLCFISLAIGLIVANPCNRSETTTRGTVLPDDEIRSARNRADRSSHNADTRIR